MIKADYKSVSSSCFMYEIFPGQWVGYCSSALCIFNINDYLERMTGCNLILNQIGENNRVE